MAKYNLNYTKAFIKDYKKLQTKEKDLTDSIIDTLAQNKALDPKHKDHALSGNLQGFRECHIKPDLLLVYKRIKKPCFYSVSAWEAIVSYLKNRIL